MPIALIRNVSSSIQRCELTHMTRERVDLDRARSQHTTYAHALAELGCQVKYLPELNDHPDAVFVEDTVVVVPEIAVLTNPGARSRRGEIDSMETVISSFRPTARIDDPGILEGGDVLRIGREVFVGCATRSCEEGINQLRSHLQPFGYVVKAIHHGDALHLKTACTYLGEGVLLVNPEWVDVEDFPDFEVLECDPLEPFACNAIRLGAKVLFPEEFPRTRERLEQRGFTVHPVPASELAKAEGGLTCSSVIFDENERGAGKTPGG